MHPGGIGGGSWGILGVPGTHQIGPDWAGLDWTGPDWAGSRKFKRDFDAQVQDSLLSIRAGAESHVKMHVKPIFEPSRMP